MPADIPIACSLSEPELRKRETTVLKSFGAQIRHVEALPDGYSIEVAAMPKDGFVEVSVRDTGVGILEK